MIRNSLTSVNYTPGRGIYIRGMYIPVPISGFVVHTEQGHEAGTVSWFQNPASQVSSNYGIGLDGNIDRIVDEANTSWANGNFESNSRTITIECEDNVLPDTVVRTDQQYHSVAQIIADASRRYNIPINRDTVKKHNEIPPFSHPECPGNLDADRIVREANTLLGTLLAPLPEPSTVVLSNYQPLVEQVSVVNANLQVRTEPRSDAPGNQANTPDGLLHAGMIADIVGYGTGQDPYGDGRNIWLKSFRGKWFWAGGTNFAKPPVPVEVVAAPIAPVVEPVVEPTPEPAAPVVPIIPESPLVPAFVFWAFEVPTKVVALNGSGVIDLTTGKAVSKYPSGRPLTVVGYIEKDGVKYLQTDNLAKTMPTHGLPATDFELYVEPHNPVDGIKAPVTVPATKPTMEETLIKTNNWFVRLLLRFVHHTK